MNILIVIAGLALIVLALR